MPNYLNYSNTSNVSGFTSAMDYSATAMQTAIGYDAFGITILGVIFIGFFIVSSKYTQERALLYSTFMTTVAAFLMVSATLLNPTWLMLCVFGLIAAIFFSNRLG